MLRERAKAMESGTLPKAVLVGVALPETDPVEFERSLDELERLVKTLGYTVVARVTQARDALSPAAVIGEGKVQELAALTGGSGRLGPVIPRKKDKARTRREAGDAERDDESDAETEAGEQDGDKIELCAVDHDISPSQARNLERAVGTPVLDRTGVIVEIFSRHAKSREARLEVEIARLKYTAPRLRESPSGRERQHLRGSGDTAVELDRRRIRDRIAELREELERIHREQATRRAQRRSQRRVALVGYTNAGKSSLMRALTGSDVLVKDKLFATLDTTVRALSPETRPRILVSDTVGFIKKLPHDLVASFKSTLDEALEASLLLHVVDASDPAWESQLAVTRSVLAEIGAGAVTSRVLMNKIDRLPAETLAALRHDLHDAWFVSAHDPALVRELHASIVGFFEASYESREFVVPYARQAIVSEMHEAGRVEAERYEAEGVYVTLRSDRDTLAQFQDKLRRRESGSDAEL
jgi:GTP-binding protein HflX